MNILVFALTRHPALYHHFGLNSIGDSQKWNTRQNDKSQLPTIEQSKHSGRNNCTQRRHNTGDSTSCSLQNKNKQEKHAVLNFIMGHLHDGVILLLLPESFRVFLSCENHGFCNLNLTGIKKIKYERKNELNPGLSNKKTFPP